MTLTVDLAQGFPRRFVPVDADMGDFAQIEPLFQRLLSTTPASPQELERWLEDASELSAALDEERTKRYIAMTSQTDDPERERAFLYHLEHVAPKVKPLLHALNEAYLRSPHRRALPARYALLDRAIETRVALFRPENVALETEDSKLKQQYQKLTGAMTVMFRGTEHTPQQMAKYLDETDRAVRQEAWELVARRRLADRVAYDDLFDAMLDLRGRIAANAGYADYGSYIFAERERFDYTAEDCLRFHDAVAETVVPLLRTLWRRRRAALGVEKLRPWDLAVDPAGRPPLRPFDGADRFAAGIEAIFSKIDVDLGRQFRFMRDRGLLDLESRKGKAPGGYQSTLQEQRVPFIFMNAVGVDADLRTLLHEGGHAFHMLAARRDPLMDYRDSPLEFCEVASMGMELLAMPHIGEFYPNTAEAERATHEHLEGIVRLFPWVATIDAFQHWLYTHPDHTRAARGKAWLEISRRFSPDVDFTGYEDIEESYWHRQLHIFQVPFYYIEYGIAQVGALQVWLQARRDAKTAVSRYRSALSFGGTRSLPELFEAAGAKFDFSAQTLGPLMDEIAKVLDIPRAGV
jgi:oligoendopeptidase F